MPAPEHPEYRRLLNLFEDIFVLLRKRFSLIMADSDEYKTIRKSSDGLYREKGSRFVSVAIHAKSLLAWVEKTLLQTSGS